MSLDSNEYVLYFFRNAIVSYVLRIEKEVYKMDQGFFDFLFDTPDISDNTESVLDIIIRTNEDNTVYANQKNVVFVNPKNYYWRFQLLTDVERVLSNNLPNKCLAIHASACKLNGKGILICGSRNCGKTTMSKILIERMGATFLADDLVVFWQNTIRGFSLPAKLRIQEKNTFAINDTETKRYLKRYISFEQEPCELKLLLFPSYTKNGVNEISRLTGIRLYMKIMKNIKESKELEQTNKEILSLCRNVPGWSVKYCSDDYMLRCVRDVLEV